MYIHSHPWTSHSTPPRTAGTSPTNGVSLALAVDLEWDLMLAREDAREAYGEQRWIGVAPIGRVLYCVVFTEGDDIYRIISLRKAATREVRDYAREI